MRQALLTACLGLWTGACGGSGLESGSPPATDASSADAGDRSEAGGGQDDGVEALDGGSGMDGGTGLDGGSPEVDGSPVPDAGATDLDASDAATEASASDAATEASASDAATELDASDADTEVDAADGAAELDATDDAAPAQDSDAPDAADGAPACAQPGLLLLDVQPIPGGTLCPNGGRRSRSGVDTNQNCVLDDDEVLSIAFLCALPAPSASTTPYLTDVATEPSGGPCAHGGQAVRAGVDRNLDGHLGNDEVENTPYVCNGLGAGALIQRMDLTAPDTLCDSGALRITSGFDDNGNLALDSAEERDSNEVCFEPAGRRGSVVSFYDRPFAPCTSGGKWFATGIDADGDGRLDPSEVAASNHWCRPASAPTSLVSRMSVQTAPPPTLCEGSGRAIVSGVDTDHNGSLGPAETLRLAPLCDPVVGPKWRSLSGRMDGLGLNGLAQGMANRPWIAGAAGVLSFDGSAFQPAAQLPPLAFHAPTQVLVAPLSDSDVWIYFGGADSTAYYLHHWEGTTWALVPRMFGYNPPTSLAAIPAADGTPMLIAAMSGGDCAGTSPATGQWTELGWQFFGTKNCDDIPDVVAGSGVNDVWAMRWSPVLDAQGVIENHLDHWDGTTWSRPAQPPLPSGYPYAVTAIQAVGPSSAWAVGPKGAVLHWDGTQWVVVSAGTTLDLDAVTVARGGEVWVGGAGGSVSRGTSTGWQSLSLPVSETVSGLWAENDTVAWATTRESGSIYRWDGQAWAAVSGPYDLRDLHGAWSPGPGALWAVGKRGLVVNVDHGARTRVDVGTSLDLLDVCGFSPNDLWVVGAAGTMLHYDGQWTPFKTPETGSISLVWGTSPSNLWAIGDAGVLRWDPAGQAWSRALRSPSYAGGGIGGTDTQVWIVGQQGIVTFAGGAFTSVPSHKVSPKYSAVWFAGGGDGWLAAHDQSLSRFDGVHAATQVASGPYARLWGLASNEVYASGFPWAGGPVLRWDGATWSEVTGISGVQALAGHGSSDLLAVGNYGAILRYE